jgi:hypothetical protein
MVGAKGPAMTVKMVGAKDFGSVVLSDLRGKSFIRSIRQPSEDVHQIALSV